MGTTVFVLIVSSVLMFSLISAIRLEINKTALDAFLETLPNRFENNTMSSISIAVQGVFEIFNTDPDYRHSIAKFFIRLLQDADNVQTDCKADILKLVDGAINGSVWAIKILDAMGKFQSGLFDTFDLKYLGHYDECISLSTEESHPKLRRQSAFETQYCRSNIPVSLVTLGIQGSTAITYGSCLPVSCSSEDVNILLQQIISHIHRNETTPVPHTTCFGERAIGGEFIFAVIIVGFLVCLVLVGTAYDIREKHMNANVTTGEENEEGVKPMEETMGDDTHNTTNGQFNHSFAHDVVHVKISVAQLAHVSEKVSMTPVSKGDAPSRFETHISKTSIPSAHQRNDSNSEKLAGDSKSDNLAGDSKTKGSRQSYLKGLMLSFSAITNASKIFSTEHTNKNLACLNGIRVLSTCYVILAHTVFFITDYDYNTVSFIHKMLTNWDGMILLYGSIAVDTFFVLSGLLVAYLMFLQLEKKGARGISWVMFYVHRFIRLTPTYMLVLMVGTVIVPHLLSGPMQPEGDLDDMAGCRANWWTNLVYINNYVKLDDSCMGWTWYLANDMQFFIISPLFVIALFYKRKLGISICCSTILLSVASIVGVSVNNDIQLHESVQAFPPKAHVTADTVLKYIYLPSYSRIGPYMVGLLLGSVLYEKSLKCSIHKVVNISCWITSIAMCCVVVFATTVDDALTPFSVGETAAYLALNRLAWSLAVAWMIFSCVTGHGGIINTILSWKFFLPFARLSYTVYLVHPLVILCFYSTSRQPIYASNYNMVYLFLGNVCLSYGIGLLAALLFESPIMGMVKDIFKA